ncbi:MAG: BatD family protein [Candidatus Methanoperedens sp.]|nr:BatD family protein [Candidatus Methanoperedens sp.]
MKKEGGLIKELIFLLLISLMVLPAAGASTQTFNFTMQNDTGLNFENGAYIVEVIELTRPVFVKVNMTNNDRSVVRNLYDSEAPIIFNQIKLGASFITETSAMIRIEFPAEWGYPKKYQIVHPVAPVGVPNIVLTKSVDKTNVNVGDVVEFKIKMENIGNATAYNLTLNEQPPNGFSNAPGSRLPSVINTELAAGASQELYYALKAVDSGTFNIEPTIAIYSSKTSKSNPLTITVAAATQEKSFLATVISLDKMNATVGELIKATVKITNTGKATAKSVRIKGTAPLGMEAIDGNLIKDYESIGPAGIEEYRFTLKATEAGNYTIHLITVYNDNEAGVPSDSDTITVTEKEGNYLYFLLPVMIFILGIVLFTIKRHREYSY